MLPPESPQTLESDAAEGITSLPISPLLSDDSSTIMFNIFCLIRHEKKRSNELQVGNDAFFQRNLAKGEPFNEHIVQCQDPSCSIRHCQTSRELFKHWISCCQDECHICMPEAELTHAEFVQHLIKRGIYHTFAQQVDQMKTNLPYMKKLLWEYL